MSSQRRFQIVHRDRPTGRKTVPTPQQGQVSKTSGKTDTQTKSSEINLEVRIPSLT